MKFVFFMEMLGFLLIASVILVKSGCLKTCDKTTHLAAETIKVKNSIDEKLQAYAEYVSKLESKKENLEKNIKTLMDKTTLTALDAEKLKNMEMSLAETKEMMEYYIPAVEKLKEASNKLDMSIKQNIFESEGRTVGKLLDQAEKASSKAKRNAVREKALRETEM